MATLLGQPVRDGQRRIAERVRQRLVERARARLLGEPLEQPAECRGAMDAGLGLRGALAQGAPGDPGNREQGRNGDEVAGVVIRVVVDDDRRAAERDGEPEPRPHGVGNLGEQKRGNQTGDGQGGGGHDEPPIDRRERGGQQPECGRSGEGEAAAAEQRQHDDRHHRDLEPQRRARLRQRVVSEGDLERGNDRPDRDQQVEPAAVRECPDPAHASNVLHSGAGARTGGLRSAVARRPEPCMAALHLHWDLVSNPEPPLEEQQ